MTDPVTGEEQRLLPIMTVTSRKHCKGSMKYAFMNAPGILAKGVTSSAVLRSAVVTESDSASRAAGISTAGRSIVHREERLLELMEKTADTSSNLLAVFRAVQHPEPFDFDAPTSSSLVPPPIINS